VARFKKPLDQIQSEVKKRILQNQRMLSVLAKEGLLK